jgi:anti-sigma regulatory factor (Ser/Thr protein kinase)
MPMHRDSTGAFYQWGGNGKKYRYTASAPRSCTRVPRDPTSATEARRFIRRFAARHHLDGRRTTTAGLVASELVANAFLHGAAPIELAVSRHSEMLRIEVTDGDSRTEVVPRPERSVTDLHGRGLHVVDAVARCWGTTHQRNSKTVWAEVGLDSPAA